MEKQRFSVVTENAVEDIGWEKRNKMSETWQGLWSDLGLHKAKFPQVAVLVGSGGKTSLMGQLARAGKEHQLRVAVLTTTHIWKPVQGLRLVEGAECPAGRDCAEDCADGVEGSRRNTERSAEQSRRWKMEKGTVTVFGRDCGDGKITFPGEECYREICREADLILVEADGSRGLPVKYPGPREPVIPDNVNMILCVCGMSGLGRPGREVCHRWELAPAGRKGSGEPEESASWNGSGEPVSAAGKNSIVEPVSAAGRNDAVEPVKAASQNGGIEACQETERITEKLLAHLLEEGYGKPLAERYPGAEFYYCLNQADTEAQAAAAKRILQRTGRAGLIMCLKDEENILYKTIGGEKPGVGNPLPCQKELWESKDRPYLALIYMASGFGRRYGSNKLLEMVGGKPLYLHGLETLVEAAGELKKGGRAENLQGKERVSGAEGGMEIRLIVVSQYGEILERAKQLGAVPVYNPNSGEGITASIHLGIEASDYAGQDVRVEASDYAGQDVRAEASDYAKQDVRPEASGYAKQDVRPEAYLFSVADQPWLKAESIVRLVEEFQESGRTMACLTNGRQRGNPVLFAAKYREELMALTGDKGGSQLLRRYPGQVLEVPVGPEELRDVDQPGDAYTAQC